MSFNAPTIHLAIFKSGLLEPEFLVRGDGCIYLWSHWGTFKGTETVAGWPVGRIFWPTALGVTLRLAQSQQQKVNLMIFFLHTYKHKSFLKPENSSEEYSRVYTKRLGRRHLNFHSFWSIRVNICSRKYQDFQVL